MKNFDWLYEFTKEEIITFFLGKSSFYFDPPKKSELLLIRWQRLAKENLKKQELLTEELNKIDTKKRDELARQINNTKDLKKKLELIKKIVPYETAFQNYIKKSKQIEKEYKEIEKLYNEIDKARGNI